MKNEGKWLSFYILHFTLTHINYNLVHPSPYIRQLLTREYDAATAGGRRHQSLPQR